MRIRKPKRSEKVRISKAGLDWKEWNVLGTLEDGRLRLVNKRTGDWKVIDG